MFNYTLKCIKKHYKFVDIFREKSSGGLFCGQIPLIFRYIVEKSNVFCVPCTDLRSSRTFQGIRTVHKGIIGHFWKEEENGRNLQEMFHKT